MPSYVDKLLDFRPASVDGFFSSILELAQFIDRQGITLDWKPKAIFPTSEMIEPTGRDLIERVFQARVYNQYSSSEGAPFVTECNEKVLHIEPSTGFFEQHPDTGELLVTSIQTAGTPLIRYAIGDSMVLGPLHSCACGRVTPIVEEIHGRGADFLVRADGAKINGGNVANIFKNVPNSIVEAQLRQKEIGAVEMRVVVDDGAFKPAHLEIVQRDFRSKFDEATALSVTIVPHIERARSGKKRFILNEIP